MTKKMGLCVGGCVLVATSIAFLVLALTGGGCGDGGGTDNGGGGGQVAVSPGNWHATIIDGQNQTPATAKVQVQGNKVAIIFSLQYQQTDANGVVHQCEEINQFDGTIQGNVVTAVCQQAVWKKDGQQVQPTLPMNMKLQVAADGKSAQGVVTSANDQVQVTMQFTGN